MQKVLFCPNYIKRAYYSLNVLRINTNWIVNRDVSDFVEFSTNQIIKWNIKTQPQKKTTIIITDHRNRHSSSSFIP